MNPNIDIDKESQLQRLSIEYSQLCVNKLTNKRYNTGFRGTLTFSITTQAQKILPSSTNSSQSVDQIWSYVDPKKYLDKYFQKAVYFYKTNNFNKCINYCDLCIKVITDNPNLDDKTKTNCLLHVSHYYDAMQYYSKCADCYTRIHKIQPYQGEELKEFYKHRGRLYFLSKQMKLSLEDYNLYLDLLCRSIKIESLTYESLIDYIIKHPQEADIVQILHDRARIMYEYKKDVTGAQEDINLCLEIATSPRFSGWNIDMIDALFLSGRLYLQTSVYTLAEQDFIACLKIIGNSPEFNKITIEIYKNLIQVNVNLKDIESVKDCINEILHLDPNNQYALKILKMFKDSAENKIENVAPPIQQTSEEKTTVVARPVLSPVTILSPITTFLPHMLYTTATEPVERPSSPVIWSFQPNGPLSPPKDPLQFLIDNFQRGLDCKNAGKIEDSLSLFDVCKEIISEHPIDDATKLYYLISLAEYYANEKFYSDSIECYHMILEIEPENILAKEKINEFKDAT